VRVPEQHPLAVVGLVAAEAVRVRADVAEGETPLERLEVLRHGQWTAFERRRGRLRAADAVERDAGRGEQRELVEAPVDVDLLDRANPVLAPDAGSGRFATPVSLR